MLNNFHKLKTWSRLNKINISNIAINKESLTNKFLLFSRQNFARKNNNKSPHNLFSKFSLPEEGENNQDYHFSKQIKRHFPNEEMMADNLEGKKMRRMMDEKGRRGLKAKEVVKEILQGKEDEEVGTGLGDNPYLTEKEAREMPDNITEMYKNEMELINKIKNQETRKASSIDPTEYKENLYTQTDLDYFELMRKSKKGKLEEKDVEHLTKFKVKKAKEEKDYEEKSDFLKENSDTFQKEDPQFENTKNKFYKSFKKSNKKEKKEFDDIDEEDNIQDLRKLKNITNPEYNQLDNPSTEMISTFPDIPDLDIVEKRSKNVQVEDSFREMMQKDINPYGKIIEKREGLIDDATKLSKMNILNIVNVKKNRNEIFEKRALQLAKLWQMDHYETKHWYYRLRREEKEIFKAILKRKKLEQKRSLKKLRSQWKIENEENIDLNYLQMLREENGDTKANLETDKFKVPKDYKNLNEFIFFGEDSDFFKHYKRTCKNILNSLTRFFQKNKQSICQGIGRDLSISVNEVKMNKSCTVVYVWYDLPFLDTPLLDIKKDDSKSFFNTIEVNLKRSEPYIKGVITREVGLKYTPEIRFIRDTLDDELKTFEDEITQVKEDQTIAIITKNNEKENKILSLLNNSKLKEQLRDIFDKINNVESRNKLYQIFIEDESQENDQLSSLDMKTKARLFSNKKVKLSDKIFSLKTTSPELYEHIFKIVKEATGVNESNVDEVFKKIEENGSEAKKNTRFDERIKKQQAKVLKKANLTEEDLKEDNTKVDFHNSVNNFLNQYDRKIPGARNMNEGLKEMKEKNVKGEFVDELIQKKYRSEIRKEVKRTKKIGKSRESRRNKSVEFWKNLENYD